MCKTVDSPKGLLGEEEEREKKVELVCCGKEKFRLGSLGFVVMGA